MCRRLPAIVPILLAIGTTAGAFLTAAMAQTTITNAAGPKAPLTFAECIKEVAEYNPVLYAAKEALKQSRLNVLRSYTKFIPSLSADFNFSRDNQRLDTGYEASSTYGAGLSGGYTIFNGFRDIAGLSQSLASYNQAEIVLQQVKSNLSDECRRAFAQLLYAQENLALSEIIYSRRKDNAAIVEMRFDAGTANKGEALRSKADAHQAEIDIREARRQVSLAQRKLNTVLGRQDISVSVVLTGKLEAANPPPPPDFDDLVKTTTQYRQAEINCYIAREGVRSAIGEFYPTLDVNYNLGVLDNNASYINLGDSWSVSTKVGVNFIDLRGTDILDLKTARSKLRQSEADFLNVANNTCDSLQQIFIAWQNMVELSEVQAEFLQAEQVRTEISRIQYQNGTKNFEEWMISENALISAQKGKLAADRNAVDAKAAWERALAVSEIP